MKAVPQRGEIYYEIQQIGHYQKITAIDAETAIEVSLMGPLSATREQLQNLALKKLQRQFNKSAKQQ